MKSRSKIGFSNLCGIVTSLCFSFVQINKRTVHITNRISFKFALIKTEKDSLPCKAKKHKLLKSLKKHICHKHPSKNWPDLQLYLLTIIVINKSLAESWYLFAMAPYCDLHTHKSTRRSEINTTQINWHPINLTWTWPPLKRSTLQIGGSKAIKICKLKVLWLKYQQCWT